MEQVNQNPFLTVRKAGDYPRLKKRTLDNMRWMGTGPSFRQYGGRMFYHMDELKEWSLETLAKSTSQF
jgi:hypothetical protein